MTRAKDDLSYDYVASELTYDPETGAFTWKRPGLGRRRAAGKTRSNGYRAVHIHGRAYMAHRLAWLLTTGRWPVGDIDHIDGDRGNNRIANLREASRSQNMWNMRCKGVQTNGRGQFKSRIYVNNVQIFLGTFPTPELARAAYLEAKQKYHGKFNPWDGGQ